MIQVQWRELGCRGAALLFISLMLAACGSSSVPVENLPGGVSEGGEDRVTIANCDQLFTQRVQPRLEYCRNCHVPGGVADVDDGKLFMLSSDESKDFANLRAAWESLSRNDNGKSRLLKMPSGTDDRTHSGGTPWPVGSDAYKEMDAMLQGFADPQACALGDLVAGVTEDFPLLAEGHRGGHAWSRYCAGKDDAAVLPVNPVSLIKPGVNAGKAVYFNAYYKDCHVNAAAADAKPTTCGDWRNRIERGGILLKGNGAQGAGTSFGGSSSEVPLLTSTAAAYNDMWKTWGTNLGQRPENYDQLVAQRWGVAIGPERNPYPLPGEDPNKTDGGSGQLPSALTQLRGDDGRWTGMIGTTCSICHGGQVGVPGETGTPGLIYGTNGLSDIGTLGRDLLLGGNVLGAVLPALSRVRGTGNITNFQLFGLLTVNDPNRLFPYLLTQAAASTGTEDPPVWWNFGHRPLKFFDGGMSSDAQRIAISAYYPLVVADPLPLNFEAAQAWTELHDQDAVAWLLDLKSPAWPGSVDTALAEQGAILFHTKNLWAQPGNEGKQRPKGGNGSCASCHGAYSPRFVNDSAYLEDPSLEGIAGYIAPRNLIGTDPTRVDGNDQDVARSFETDWFGYPDQRGTEEDCGDQNLDRIRGDRENGYLAPPLYGVWATAPYFHNGSVPNVWEVLKPADRKPIWQRVSTPNETGFDVVMGFDSSFLRAYDQEKLGWKYLEIVCGLGGAVPYLQCDPENPNANPLLQDILSLAYGNGGFAWNAPSLLQIPLSNAQIENRKIYNTRMYSQSNGGHEFTAVLTDPERRALIEYLKTL